MKIPKNIFGRTKRPRGTHVGCVFETLDPESPAASTAFVANSLLQLAFMLTAISDVVRLLRRSNKNKSLTRNRLTLRPQSKRYIRREVLVSFICNQSEPVSVIVSDGYVCN